MAVDIDLRRVDVNQCDGDSENGDVFAGTHKCHETTEVSNVTVVVDRPLYYTRHIPTTAHLLSIIIDHHNALGWAIP